MRRGYAETMTDAATSSGVRPRVGALGSHPLPLWAAFVVVHALLGWICLTAPSLPMGDVTIVYRFWMQHGFGTGSWVGLDTAWVYPIVAIVPMLLSSLAGWDAYAGMWLTIVLVVDAVAFAVLVHRGGRERRTAGVAWWWLAFLLALGPVALGRIDAIATAVAIMGVLVIAARPVLGAALLTIGAWVKVWPAALVAAGVIVLRQRLWLVLGALGTTVAVVLAAFLAGGDAASVFSFVTQQSGRGLQIESVLATPGMWAAWAGAGTRVYYDTGILTYQLEGPGVFLTANLSTPLLMFAVAGISALGIAGVRRGVHAARLLAPLALAFTVALIAFNKVGSPQFAGWLAVPVILGLVTARRAGGESFRVPAVLSLVIAALTHLVYPYFYGALLHLDTALLIVLTARNALYVVLFVWAVSTLARLLRMESDQL